ncbi:hypothetical protein DFH06DRAFT_1227378 [Mycena polygramma]|nr:hypothetical protein DFH06DRAFT_1227378 [Mycena polygramma]
MTPRALESGAIAVSDGLQGQDSHFETLMALWEDLQLSSFDLASQPDCDFLSFAQTAFFFGVITVDGASDSEDRPAPPLNSDPWAHANFEPSGGSVDRQPTDSDESSIEHSADKLNVNFNGEGSQPVDSGKAGILETLVDFMNDPYSTASSWIWPREIRDELYAGAKSAATRKPIGIVYLVADPLSYFSPQQIVNLGIILDAAHRGKGYARNTIQLVIKHAFEHLHCHRIQAPLLSLSSKDRMLSLLTQRRFGHEGTKRRSFFNPMVEEWQDVTTLAILDTDWAMRGFFKPAPKSLWDELFARHQRERDELLRWEEDQSRLKRNTSSETIRAMPLALDTDSEAESVASSTSANMGKRRMAPSDWNRDPYDGSSSDSDGDFGDAVFTRARYIPRVSSPTLSEISLESVPASIRSTPSTPSTPSASGSDWDMVDSASSGSSSFGDEE